MARKPAAIILSGGPSSVYEAGRSAARSGDARGRRARVRHLLRLHGDGAGARWQCRQDGSARVRPHRRLGARAGHAPRRTARHADLLDVARRRGHRRSRRIHGQRQLAARHRRSVRGHRTPPRRRPVAPRGHAQRARPAHPRAVPRRDRRLPPDLDQQQHRRGADQAHPRAGGRLPGHLGSVRRRRLGRVDGARAARDR